MEETVKNNNKKLFTILEVSTFTGISEQEIIRLVMLKELKAIKIGRSIRISEKEFEVFSKKLWGASKSDNTPISAADVQSKERILYTAEQVAKILQLSINNVWLLLQEGRLNGFKIRDGRSSWRIPAESLGEFIESRSDSNAVS